MHAGALRFHPTHDPLPHRPRDISTCHGRSLNDVFLKLRFRVRLPASASGFRFRLPFPASGFRLPLPPDVAGSLSFFTPPRAASAPDQASSSGGGTRGSERVAITTEQSAAECESVHHERFERQSRRQRLSSRRMTPQGQQPQRSGKACGLRMTSCTTAAALAPIAIRIPISLVAASTVASARRKTGTLNRGVPRALRDPGSATTGYIVDHASREADGSNHADHARPGEESWSAWGQRVLGPPRARTAVHARLLRQSADNVTRSRRYYQAADDVR